MPRRQERVIDKRTVDALAVEGKDAVFWDRSLPGFGVRVYPSGLKQYVAQSRGPGGSKRATLGRHGEIAPERARRLAAAAIDRIKRGEAPVPPPPEPELTMAGLAERYMRDYVPSHCTASSAAVYRTALDNHILPALGGMPVGSVGREQVTDLHYAMRGTPHAANTALKIVAKMLSLAVECRSASNFDPLSARNIAPFRKQRGQVLSVGPDSRRRTRWCLYGTEAIHDARIFDRDE